MTIDHIAMWIGYAVMIGSASGIAGLVVTLGLSKLFWSGGKECFAFLRYIRWKAKGSPEAPDHFHW